MIDCLGCGDLLPWYVQGALGAAEAGEAAAHLATCTACREELASAVRLATEVRAALHAAPRAPEEIWTRVARDVKASRRPGLDAGSFYAGFTLGLSVRGRAAPVSGHLRLLGEDVPLFRIGEGGHRERRTLRRRT